MSGSRLFVPEDVGPWSAVASRGTGGALEELTVELRVPEGGGLGIEDHARPSASERRREEVEVFEALRGRGGTGADPAGLAVDDELGDG